jgi:hypothetical protein
MTIRKIISGGQTGVDIAALRAAREVGYDTGGKCPKGWLTETGPQRELLQEFGLSETTSPKYPVRTRANVDESDCTIVIADRLDAGSQLTTDLCRKLAKPMRFIPRNALPDEAEMAEVLAWLRAHPHGIVNIAGNRESKSPGIGAEVEAFLRKLFAAMD